MSPLCRWREHNLFQSTPPRGGRQYIKKNQFIQTLAATVARTSFFFAITSRNNSCDTGESV